MPNEETRPGRAFYRTVVQIEVLSEHPIDFENLRELIYMVTEGDCSGNYDITEHEIVDGKRMAQLLLGHGSDPSFFHLTEEGEDDDEL